MWDPTESLTVSAGFRALLDSEDTKQAWRETTEEMDS